MAVNDSSMGQAGSVGERTGRGLASLSGDLEAVAALVAGLNDNIESLRREMKAEFAALKADIRLYSGLDRRAGRSESDAP